uniref:hypothetical protein n=1 Tax=Sphaerisporangium sp. CA-236357 TaxID=3240030 RepID=UPI003F49958C
MSTTTTVMVLGERQIETLLAMCQLAGRCPHELTADILLKAIRDSQYDHEVQHLVAELVHRARRRPHRPGAWRPPMTALMDLPAELRHARIDKISTHLVKIGGTSRLVMIDAGVTVPVGTRKAWSTGDLRHASAVRTVYADGAIVNLACCGVDYTSISNLIGSHPRQKENASQCEALPRRKTSYRTLLVSAPSFGRLGRADPFSVSFHVRRRR